MKFPPAARYTSKIWREAFLSAPQPKVIAPKASGDTLSPERPNVRKTVPDSCMFICPALEVSRFTTWAHFSGCKNVREVSDQAFRRALRMHYAIAVLTLVWPYT